MVLKQILKILLVTSSIWFCLTISAAAQQVQDKSANAKLLRNSRVIREIPRLSEIELTSTSAQQLLVQSSAPPNTPTPEVVKVTAVKANPTTKGVEVILQTTKGEQLQVTNRSAGNNFIADIPNAQLHLPNGDGFTFRSQKPLVGITEITVTNLDVNTIRVTATGESIVPIVELYDSPNEGLIFGVASTAPTQQAQPQTQQPQTQQPENQTQPT
ncbi:AMIN domain-containing protein [Nostoc sp.]|uniref:AMIN domain-containing protein n=1 Tax=Nostoc sp. TaxID=1180 RepID=UPI002FF72799